MKCCKFLIMFRVDYCFHDWPCKRTHVSRKLLFLLGPPCAGRRWQRLWELDASSCVLVNPWEMALEWCRQSVCTMQSFSSRRTRPLLLLESLNAIMPVGATSIYLFGILPAAHAAVSGLWRRNTLDAIMLLLGFPFSFYNYLHWHCLLSQFKYIFCTRFFWQPSENKFELHA